MIECGDYFQIIHSEENFQIRKVHNRGYDAHYVLMEHKTFLFFKYWKFVAWSEDIDKCYNKMKMIKEFDAMYKG